MDSFQSKIGDKLFAYWFKLAFLGWATHQVPHQSPRPQAEGFGEALGELNSPEKTN